MVENKTLSKFDLSGKVAEGEQLVAGAADLAEQIGKFSIFRAVFFLQRFFNFPCQ